MRDLDARAQGLMKDIDKLADDYLKNLKKESPEKKKEQLTHIQNLFNKAKEYGDDKVQLAIQTYELVDKHIRRLDSDLARFEAEIQDKALNSSRAQEETNASKKGRKKLKEKEKRKKGAAGASSEDESKTARKKQKKGELDRCSVWNHSLNVCTCSRRIRRICFLRRRCRQRRASRFYRSGPPGGRPGHAGRS